MHSLSIAPLIDGDEAYPRMLAAIDGAERSVSLLSYIFENDELGRRFVTALARARERGVAVRVLVDAAGMGFGVRPIDRALRHADVPVARFMPAWLPRTGPYVNLRNHRKILVVDGRQGFAGGLNIHQGNLVAAAPAEPVRDVHFALEGPVVRHLQEVFAEDWEFATGEALEGDAWFPPLEPRGPTLARGIADGPDEDFEQVRWTLLAALACARNSVCVVTPYFLPDQSMVTAFRVARLRGIEIDLVLPARSDIRIVDWASQAQLSQVLEPGCRVWLSPPPFDHSKLLVVDGEWLLFGSANWDPRSLRLNFELAVECYDAELAQAVDAIIAAKMATAHQLTCAEVEARGLPVKLRDGIVRLLSPYL